MKHSNRNERGRRRGRRPGVEPRADRRPLVSVFLAAFAAALALSVVNAWADPKTEAAAPTPTYHRQVEKLDRGLVAVRPTASTAYIGWRLLGDDPQGVAFNLYRAANGGAAVKLNPAPLTQSTNFVDSTANLNVANSYVVRAVVDGVEQAPSEAYSLPASPAIEQHLTIPLQPPPSGSAPSGTTPGGRSYTYNANDASVGDLDGDGQYEVVLKWDPSNSKDNSRSGYTGNTYVDAYTLEGQRLWRIDLGHNIRSGAHYTQMAVYDLDGDGRAEIVMKTAPGTIDGQGAAVLMEGDSATADYRNRSGYVLRGPEYLTVFDGLTGAQLDTVAFTPARGSVSEWGDSYGNRADRFTVGVGYFDGTRPSVVFGRGYYGPQAGFEARNEVAAYDWRDGELTERWVFKAATNDVNPDYIGQGAHSLTIGDVDGDGFDEVVYGASAIDHDGTGLYTTGLGHGDALHMSDMDPTRPGLEVFMVHESRSEYQSDGRDAGGELRDAATGELLFQIPSNNDVGRGVAMDIDPNHLGYEFWATTNRRTQQIYNVSGEALYESPRNMMFNFGVWWDGDLSRELLDGTTISKWNSPGRSNLVSSGDSGINSTAGLSSNNGSKSTPSLVADILGDWREEVIWRRSDNSALEVWTTAIPTERRLTTLMHDTQYRVAVAWQNGAYNQPPHPSFYLGTGMQAPPRPQIYFGGQPDVAKANLVAAQLAWPEVTQTARPWTRWWWHGSAVDAPNLTRLLEAYRDAGLGGVEITCIYGVKGNGARNRAYLSEAWIEAVRHTLAEAQRLGMGVDLPAGSGWRMGGPSVLPADANSRLEITSDKANAGDLFTKRFGESTPQSAMALSSDGGRVDLTEHIAEGALAWRVPEGEWTVYTLAFRWAGDRVKRPGPGGEGLNINPFSKTSVEHFLAHFGQTLRRLPGVRAQFHDSFEYDGNWQPEFLAEFAARRGYRLEEQLPALAGDGPPDTVGRVKCDYRETLADLVLENLVEPWAAWAHGHGQLARNQSHGSPANWLDLYAAVDIPETESFGRLQGDDADPLVLKFASSAANVAGKRLVSSESATWLDEHFHVTLAQVKQIVDRLLLAGVNHIFYHGAAYSPADAPWPGWLFYASTQLNPQNPIWRDLPALNAYVTRCQSVLQASNPDNDVLLYWPLHVAWHNPAGLRMEVRVHNGHDWFYGRPLGDAAVLLEQNGTSFDYVSDRGLASCAWRIGRIEAPGGGYSTVVVPRAQHMPLATLTRLAELAEGGATVVFWGGPPSSEPGMAGAQPSPAWERVSQQVRSLADEGRVHIGDDLPALLRAAGVRNEQPLKDAGLGFVRKQWNGGYVYFLNNQGEAPFDGWAPLAAPLQSAALMDPMTGNIGSAEVRPAADGRSAVRLQLAPGQSVLVCCSDKRLDADGWAYQHPAGVATTLAGPWQVTFVSGGPNLPEGFETVAPKPWTEAPDASAQNFAGTASYAASFDTPAGAERLLLDLGEVLGSARVRINGAEVATLIAPPYAVALEKLAPTGNKLEVEVTGVAANRIRDLDRRGVVWRVFEDINLVTIDYKPFDASSWPVRPLGLTGPVTLTPLRAAGE